MIYILLAVGTALIALTVAMTARSYASLPDQVALQFWPDGSPFSLWAKPAIWLIVAIQLLSFGFFAYITRSSGSQPPASTDVPLMIICDCVLALTWRVQNLLLSAAMDSDNRAKMDAQYYIFIGACIAAALFTGFYFLRPR